MEQLQAFDAIDPVNLAQCLFEESNDALFLFDPESQRVLEVNRAARKLSGFSRSELLELEIGDLIDSGQDDQQAELERSYRVTTVFHSRESYRLRGKWQEWMVNVTVSRLHTVDSVLGLIAVRDITSRCRIESELRKAQRELQAVLDDRSVHLEVATEMLHLSETKYRSIVENSQEWIWETDLDGRYTFCNQAVETMLGYPSEQMIGRHHSCWMEPDDAWTESETRDRIESGKGWSQWIGRWRHRDDSVRYLESSAAPIRDVDGRVTGFRGCDRDITQRVDAEKRLIELERELTHVSRLSTMGQMVAGIAHEINQPLSAIANFSDAALKKIEQSEIHDERLTQWVAHISQQAIRCGDIIRRLRRFSRKEDRQRESVDVRNVIQDSVAILNGVIRANGIVVESSMPDGPLILTANPAALQQVFVNLLRNACDAAAGFQEHPCIHVSGYVRDRELYVTVKDNGPGVDAPAISHMFEPFFSTKVDGMGMGLAISKSIVEDHCGQILVEKDQSFGASISVVLPLAEACNVPERTPVRLRR